MGFDQVIFAAQKTGFAGKYWESDSKREITNPNGIRLVLRIAKELNTANIYTAFELISAGRRFLQDLLKVITKRSKIFEQQIPKIPLILAGLKCTKIVQIQSAGTMFGGKLVPVKC